MTKKTQEDIDNSKGGMAGVAMIGVASIIAAPFTSMWVPVGVIGFFAAIIVVLSVLNLVAVKSKNPVTRSFAQIYRVFGWAADYLRF